MHRTEPELKTHTSYLVFAVLPRAWSAEDEAAALARWSKNVRISSHAPKSQRQLKKEAKQRAKAQKPTREKNEVPGAAQVPTEVPTEAGQADR